MDHFPYVCYITSYDMSCGWDGVEWSLCGGTGQYNWTTKDRAKMVMVAQISSSSLFQWKPYPMVNVYITIVSISICAWENSRKFDCTMAQLIGLR